MKLRNLLVLGALLVAGGASAAIVERQKPALPEPIAPYTDGVTSMYMYNVGAEKFFCGGNSWGTQTSIGDEGYRVYFEQYVVDEAIGWDGTTVIFKDSCLAKSGALKEVFFDNVNGGCFVDRGSQANRFWKLEKNADNNYYRLSMAECNQDYQAWQVDAHPNTFWGWDSANGTVVSSLLEPSVETVHVDWGFCTVAAYDAYKEVLAVYDIAQELKSQVETAAAAGIDVAAWETVYNNAAATTEELETAIAAVKDALAKAEEQSVDPLNPVDKTSLITNPSYDANNNTGWNGTTPGFQSYDNAEHYNKTFDSWQLVTGLPNGLYKMTVQGFYRPATADAKGAVFYAANGTDSLTIDVPNINSAAALESKPNNMQSSGDAFHAGHYGVELYFVVTNNQARIGIALPALTGGSDWVIWDNWQLTYYGNKGEATYTGALAGFVNEALPAFDGREAEMTVGLLDTYKATLNGLTATDLTSLNEALAAIEKATADVQANIDAWVEFSNQITRGNEVRTDNSYIQTSYMQTMAAYVARQAPTILKAKALSSEELAAEISKLDGMIWDAILNGLGENADVTDMFLTNARYDNGTTGWQGNWTAVAHGCMEAYELDWDAYQIVEAAPQGVYSVSLQGFYRVKRGDEAYALYQNGGQICPGHVYINNNLNEVKCVFDEPVRKGEGYIYSAEGTGPESNPNVFVDYLQGDSVFFPNDMKTAGEAFTAGMYVSEANGLVAKKGEQLRIGVKGKKQTGTWVIWDNFKVVYRGKQIEYTMPYLKEAVKKAEANLKQAMAKDTKMLVEAAKKNAENLFTSTDEEAVFEALVQIYAANDSVNASADLFAELTAKAEELQNAIMIYSSTATENAINAAYDLLTEMLMGVEASALTKEEAKELIAEVAPVLADLIRPAGGSDAEPADYTAFIASAGFEDESGNASTEGWTGAEGATGSGAYEFFQKTFDLYQDINYLTNGTYRLEVSAFERLGSQADNYAAYAAGKDTATTYVYGVSGGVTFQKEISNIASAAILSNDAYGIEGCSKVDFLLNAEVGADSLYWVPNTMASGAAFFNDLGSYTDTIFVEVTDGTLRIGMKKEAQGSNDWVMLDNWRLYYLGTSSVNKPDAIESVVAGTETTVLKREFYTLGGAKVNKMTEGIYIIRTVYSNGAVTVKKVIK